MVVDDDVDLNHLTNHNVMMKGRAYEQKISYRLVHDYTYTYIYIYIYIYIYNIIVAPETNILEYNLELSIKKSGATKSKIC